jgi:two-component system response regulator FixJ
MEMTVHIVDDDALIRLTLEQVFRSAGFATHAYASADAFLNCQICTDNSCLILDLRMPSNSGLWLHAELRNRGIDLPVIIYTGNADVDVAVKLMSEGAYTLLQKPMSNELLIQKVQEAIQSHQQAQHRLQPVREAQRQLQKLSAREYQIAQLLADGRSAPDIGERLHLSPRTIEAHRARILDKLEIRSVARLAKLVALADAAD